MTFIFIFFQCFKKIVPLPSGLSVSDKQSSHFDHYNPTGFQDFFFVVSVKQFDYYVSGHGFLCGYPVCGLMNFLNLQIDVFLKFWELFSYIFYI